MSHKTYFLISAAVYVRRNVLPLTWLKILGRIVMKGLYIFTKSMEFFFVFFFLHKKERYRKTINILCYHILCKYSCMLKIHFLHFYFYISFMLEIYKFTGMLFNIIKSLLYHVTIFLKFDIISIISNFIGQWNSFALMKFYRIYFTLPFSQNYIFYGFQVSVAL